ncbi:MOT9-like protein [Mya arenaria]|uniref:MOT9-like protein n=1 Tax=Mya arenaria TaxID=6604 RepID=A0ABY7G2I0_MYAAR|nr:MOT9-like protein [Mya arenaria]
MLQIVFKSISKKLLTGPIASILEPVYGYRPVAIFGASLVSVSFFLSAGLGLLAIVFVGHYFKKKRALATGIAACGRGLGGFVFGPLSEFLIEKYTLKGVMLIISAIVLNLVPISTLLRPLEGSNSYSERKRRSASAVLALNGKRLEGASVDISSDEKSSKKCSFVEEN